LNASPQRAQAKRRGLKGAKKHGTEAAVDEEVEGVAVAGVGGSGAVWGKLLEALDGDGAEVAGEGRVLRQHDGALGHEAVNQRLLAAVHGAPPQKPLTETLGRNNRRRQESAREFTRGDEL